MRKTHKKNATWKAIYSKKEGGPNSRTTGARVPSGGGGDLFKRRGEKGVRRPDGNKGEVGTWNLRRKRTKAGEA